MTADSPTQQTTATRLRAHAARIAAAKGDAVWASDALVPDLEAAAAEMERMRVALEWYGENARLARLIHSEGDKGRHALSADGGKRAREMLGNE